MKSFIISAIISLNLFKLKGKSYLAEQFRQMKCSLAESHVEISFWFGKGDIPNEKIRLPPLEVHFRVEGCGRTDSEGGLVKNKMKGGSLY